MKFINTPSFCQIAPISFSHLVSGRPAHLVLAHLLDKDLYPVEKHSAVDAYRNFILKEKEHGAFIMCDNSAYELKVPYAPERLMQIASSVKADAIVLPDYPFLSSQRTIDAAKLYAPQFRAAGFLTFFVPQSERGDTTDWIAAYDWAANGEGRNLVDIIGISILGVPNAWNKCDPSYARVVAMNELLTHGIYNSDVHHHFLGLNAGPALEIPTLLRMGVLDTIDSSGPVQAGILGHRYTEDADSYQTVKKLRAPVDFFMPFTKDEDTINRIIHNCEMTDDLFHQDVYLKSSPWYAEE